MRVDQQRCAPLRTNFPFTVRCGVTGAPRAERRRFRVSTANI